jgi:hypothetical protein
MLEGNTCSEFACTFMATEDEIPFLCCHYLMILCLKGIG